MKSKAFEKLDLKLKELAGIEGRVGWFESARYEDGTPVAYVMAIQELGSPPIPPRPFMRPTAIDKKDEWIKVAAQASKGALAGNMSAENVMELLTLKAESDVHDTIESITSPPLSPITIELRAMKMRDPNIKITGKTVGEAAAKVNKPGYQTPNVSTKPLNDTGFAIATLTHVVEKS